MHAKDILEEIRDKTIKIARGVWSTPNHMGVNTIIDILSSNKGREELTNEIEECKRVINLRADIFLKEAKDNNLIHYPYNKGFFITLIVDNAVQVSEKLMKQDIYLAPISDNQLRVALCSIPTDKVFGLAEKIEEAIKSITSK